MGKPRKTYTTEFKIEAVRLYETSGKSASQIERELGIRPRDFAFTGTSWSSCCLAIPMCRYCRAGASNWRVSACGAFSRAG